MSAPLRESLIGAAGMACFRRDALNMFDLSVDGFWRSFAAVPLAMALLLLRLFLPDGQAAGPLSTGQFVVSGGMFLLHHLLALVAILGMSRIINRTDRFSVFAITFNWCSIFMQLAVLVMAVVDSLLINSIGGLGTLLGSIYAYALVWFVLRVSFACDALLALLLTVVVVAVQQLANYGVGALIDAFL